MITQCNRLQVIKSYKTRHNVTFGIYHTSHSRFFSPLPSLQNASSSSNGVCLCVLPSVHLSRTLSTTPGCRAHQRPLQTPQRSGCTVWATRQSQCASDSVPSDSTLHHPAESQWPPSELSSAGNERWKMFVFIWFKQKAAVYGWAGEVRDVRHLAPESRVRPRKGNPPRKVRPLQTWSGSCDAGVKACLWTDWENPPQWRIQALI